ERGERRPGGAGVQGRGLGGAAAAGGRQRGAVPVRGHADANLRAVALFAGASRPRARGRPDPRGRCLNSFLSIVCGCPGAWKTGLWMVFYLEALGAFPTASGAL